MERRRAEIAHDHCIDRAGERAARADHGRGRGLIERLRIGVVELGRAGQAGERNAQAMTAEVVPVQWTHARNYVKRKSMSPPISAKRKKKRGRPATGTDPMIGLRLSKKEIARLDRWAKANGYTRSEAIRVLIERGLQ